jgi:hypothetical protein
MYRGYCIRYLCCYYYYWVDTSAGGLLGMIPSGTNSLPAEVLTAITTKGIHRIAMICITSADNWPYQLIES